MFISDVSQLGGRMRVIFRGALRFLSIRFFVVLTIMIVARLLARPDVPTLGRKSGQKSLRRGFIFVVRLPKRVLHSIVRLVQSRYSLLCNAGVGGVRLAVEQPMTQGTKLTLFVYFRVLEKQITTTGFEGIVPRLHERP